MTAGHVVDGMPDNVYHADSALSSSGAKALLPPSCPALFKWERDHGRPEKSTFDFGHAAHHMVLGIGAPLDVVQADDWRTTKAKEAKAAAYAAGHVPLLEKDHRKVIAMADALREHPIASALFDPEIGKPEQSIFWHDDRHDIDRRARLDWLPDVGPGRLIIGDYKTCDAANLHAIRKSVANYSYHQQDAWYRDAAKAAELSDDPAFLFVFQEKTPPYLITVVELDAQARREGQARNDMAMEIFAECSALDVWPGYSDDIELIDLPAWATHTTWETA